jgi:hypothetical protein
MAKMQPSKDFLRPLIHALPSLGHNNKKNWTLFALEEKTSRFLKFFLRPAKLFLFKIWPAIKRVWPPLEPLINDHLSATATVLRSLEWSLCSGVNFTNVLNAVFMYEVASAAFLCLHYRFVLYWHKPTGAKAACRTLMKLSPGFTVQSKWFLVNSSGPAKFFQ